MLRDDFGFLPWVSLVAIVLSSAVFEAMAHLNRHWLARGILPLTICVLLGPAIVVKAIDVVTSNQVSIAPGRGITSALLSEMLLVAWEIMCFGYVYSVIGLRQQSAQQDTFNQLDCLYFSVVTWTTLGYGDFVPRNKWGRLLVAYEAILGYFVMAALFAQLVTFAETYRR